MEDILAIYNSFLDRFYTIDTRRILTDVYYPRNISPQFIFINPSDVVDTDSWFLSTLEYATVIGRQRALLESAKLVGFLYGSHRAALLACKKYQLGVQARQFLVLPLSPDAKYYFDSYGKALPWLGGMRCTESFTSFATPETVRSRPCNY